MSSRNGLHIIFAILLAFASNLECYGRSLDTDTINFITESADIQFIEISAESILPDTLPEISDLYGDFDIDDYYATRIEKLPAEYKFNAKQLILPGSLIALGAAGVSSQFTPLKNAVRDQFQDWSNGRKYSFDDHIQYTPVLGYLVMGLVGVPCKHRFMERFMVCATSYMALGIMVNSVKYTVKELRPSTGRRNSFPSGHTATAFMGAELIRHEYGLGVAIGAYGIAGVIGIMRMYNNMHWINDVIAGAGVGILSARIGYWMLPLYRKWFHWDNKKAVSILPGYDPETRSANIGLIATF